MTEASPLDYLFSLQQHGIKLGLDNIRILCEALGHPERTFRSVIVAGTNGKGSVTAMIDTALQDAGLTTGRFTSPHLIDLEERFVVNGTRVSQKDLSGLTKLLHETICRLQASGRLEAPPTFFEVTTAIAFEWFRRLDVQVAVLEVGMGGRFDATNVVSPIAAVITSVDLDHQEFLGHTLPEITFEKAGVIQAGGLVVTGETKPDALNVLRQICRNRGARLVETVRDVTTKTVVRHGLSKITLTTPHRTYGPLMLSLRGRHQVENAAVAVRLLEEIAVPEPLSPLAIEAGLIKTRWPGRLELRQVTDKRWVLMDAAHNVAAAAALGRYLVEMYPSGLPLVFAAMRDKDVDGTIRALEGSITGVVCTSLRSPRALRADMLARVVATSCPDVPRVVVNSPRAALETAWQENDVVCAAGSMYLIGELTEILIPYNGSTNVPTGMPG